MQITYCAETVDHMPRMPGDKTTYEIIQKGKRMVMKTFNLNKVSDPKELQGLADIMKRVLPPLARITHRALCVPTEIILPDPNMKLDRPSHLSCAIITPDLRRPSLQEYMDDKSTNFSYEDMKTILTLVAKGMYELHSRGVLHGKLHTYHIVQCEGGWKLINYGLWEVENEARRLKKLAPLPKPTVKDDVLAYCEVVLKVCGGSIHPSILMAENFEQVIRALKTMP
jgi:serine/threonine protein kinase